MSNSSILEGLGGALKMLPITQIDIRSLTDIARIFEDELILHDRTYRLKLYENTFLGTDAVDLLEKILNQHRSAPSSLATKTVTATTRTFTRQHALLLGRTLADKFNMFYHVEQEHSLVDDDYIYKFTDVADRRCLPSKEKEENIGDYLEQLMSKHEDETEHSEDEGTEYDEIASLRMTMESLGAKSWLPEDAERKVGLQGLDLEQAAEALKSGVKVKNYEHCGKVYSNTFLGSDAVDVLMAAGMATSRAEAERIGKALSRDDEHKLFHHYTGEHDFEDNHYFYTFTTASNATTSASKQNADGASNSPEVTESDHESNEKNQDLPQNSASVSLQRRERDFKQQQKTSSRMHSNQFLNWSSSVKNDPRYRIYERFQHYVAHLGVEGFKEASPKKEELHPAKVFTVWRPTSSEAINLMMKGQAVGKGLDIKGKSAKTGKFSGFVPFLQIGINKHRDFIRPLSRNGSVRIFFSFEVETTILERLQKLAKHMTDTVERAKVMLANSNGIDKSQNQDVRKTLDSWDMADPTIHLVNDYSHEGCFGIELPMRLFWEAFVASPRDITRKPGSVYDTGRPSTPSLQDLNNATLMAKPVAKDVPKAVLWQNATKNDPFNPQELLMAYEEHGRVLPVASDFDAFLVGTKHFHFDGSLPSEQIKMLQWTVNQIGNILDGPQRPGSWTKRWWENLDRELNIKKSFQPPNIPIYGFCDPTSYSIFQTAVQEFAAIDGSVRHGPECFNYKVPQEIDEEFLVVSECLGEVPWQKMDEKQLQEFLLEKINDGYTFPLNPMWILTNPGWKAIYDKLITSDAKEVKDSMAIWYPQESGIRECIEEICSRHVGGFHGGPLRSQEEVQKRFVSLLTKEGKVHRKKCTSFIRRGIKGEKIVTTIHGTLQTENTVKDDESWVVMGKAAGEYYVLSNEDFRANYDETSAKPIDPATNRRLYQQGFQEYNSKSKVWARKVTESDMNWFRYGSRPNLSTKDGRAAYFMAPWGDYVRVEKGDVLVMRFGSENEEIYRVEYFVFDESYEPVCVDLRLSAKIISEREICLDTVEETSLRRNLSWDGQIIRSQEEVQKRFLTLLRNGGKVFRKASSSFIRRGIKGEKIVTTADGELVTENTVNDDSSWVVCDAVGGHYIISNSNFQFCYDESSAETISEKSRFRRRLSNGNVERLHREGFKVYKSKKKVFVREVDANDMDWFHFGGDPTHGRQRADRRFRSALTKPSAMPNARQREDRHFRSALTKPSAMPNAMVLLPSGGCPFPKGYQNEIDQIPRQQLSLCTNTTASAATGVPPIKHSANFEAPWGEPMLVRPGDLLVTECPARNDEVYRIDRAVFEELYQPFSDSSFSVVESRVKQVISASA